jgi:hypothetical protein
MKAETIVSYRIVSRECDPSQGDEDEDVTQGADQ